jgi:ABC-type transport system substrate-binding protein
MKRHYGWSLVIGLLVMVGFVGIAAPQQPKSGGTLRVSWEADITGLDPYISPGVQSWHMVGNLFNSLVTINTQLHYIPELAESWDILENGKVYVFHLRKGVKFHDGTDFDAKWSAGTISGSWTPRKRCLWPPFSASSTPWKPSIPTPSNSPSNIPA